ncbi:cytochrome P450 2K6-like isoform X2 [Pseudophryne corroboree]|uniref:cytochrome P450 2K6-like isoform X2 n=1 Tax=Pseudophryne corroboree TaxID=495146 RepID=UPI0030813492
MDPVTIVLSAVVILLLTYVYNNQKQNSKNFPPGPKPLPIIGNLHMIDKNKPINTCFEMSKKYGPVFCLHLGLLKMVVLSGYDTIKDALINHAEEFSDRPVAPITFKLVKDNGKPFDNLTVINAAVANIIVALLLNRRFEYDDPDFLKLVYLVTNNIRLMGKPLALLYNFFPSVMDWLPGVHQTVIENLRTLHNFIRATFRKQKKELDVNDQRNLIDAFLAKQLEGKPESTLYYHNDNLTALIADLFGAGMDTTTTTLRWGFLLMMKYPDIQKKVQNEIERVVGSAQPRVEHRIQMPYTDAVLHEIQRFGDILPGSAPHSTSQDVTFRGYFIPKGTLVLPFLASALRDAAYFEKPDEFYPEHFLTSEGQFKKNEAFIPFSMGKRSCAGQILAKMELFLFFTALLQNFTLQAPPGAQLDLSPELGATNAPQPYDTCAIPRSKNMFFLDFQQHNCI